MNRNKIFTNTFFVAVAAMFCCALWGSGPPFIKVAYELMNVNGVSSIVLFAGIQFALGGFFTILVYCITQKQFRYPHKKNWIYVIKVSCFQTILQYIFYYIGLTHTTAVKGTIINGSNVFFFNAYFKYDI